MRPIGDKEMVASQRRLRSALPALSNPIFNITTGLIYCQCEGRPFQPPERPLTNNEQSRAEEGAELPANKHARTERKRAQHLIIHKILSGRQSETTHQEPLCKTDGTKSLRVVEVRIMKM